MKRTRAKYDAAPGVVAALNQTAERLSREAVARLDALETRATEIETFNTNHRHPGVAPGPSRSGKGAV